MTLRLTTVCSQNCRHCLINANIDGKTIDENTLNNFLRLLKYIDIPILNISGGEITEIDNWFDVINVIIDFIKKNNLKTRLLILSNGTFLFDNDKVNKMKLLLEDNIIHSLFISTNKTYYRDCQKVLDNVGKISYHEKVHINIYDRKEILKNLGRARNLNVNLNVEASCKRMYDIIRRKKFDNLKEYCNLTIPTYCSPMINSDGNIYLGWSNDCVSVGNINVDSYDTIYNNIINYKPCRRCKQII